MATYSSFVFYAGEQRSLRSDEWEDEWIGDEVLWTRSPPPEDDEGLVEQPQPCLPRPLTPISDATTKVSHRILLGVEKRKKKREEKEEGAKAPEKKSVTTLKIAPIYPNIVKT